MGTPKSYSPPVVGIQKPSKSYVSAIEFASILSTSTPKDARGISAASPYYFVSVCQYIKHNQPIRKSALKRKNQGPVTPARTRGGGYDACTII